MVTTIVRVIMSEMETTIATATSIGVTTVTEMKWNGPDVPPQNHEVTLGIVKIVWRELRICCTK